MESDFTCGKRLQKTKKTDDQSLRQHIRVYTTNTSTYYEGLNIILFSGKQKL